MIMMMIMMVVVMTLLLESRSPAQVYHSVLAPAHHREKLWFGRMTVNKWEDRLYLDVLLALRWKKVLDKAPHISCGGGAINQVKWKPSWQIMLRRRGSFLLLAFWHIYALYHAERVILRLVWWSFSDTRPIPFATFRTTYPSTADPSTHPAIDQSTNRPTSRPADPTTHRPTDR